MNNKVQAKNYSVFNFTVYMVAGIIITFVMSVVSILYGAADIHLTTIWDAIFHFDTTLAEHQVIRNFRIPRTIADIIVGCSLGVSGAIMQGTTRNPLADSGLMGISSGAAFAIAVCLAFFPQHSYGQLMLFACIGAALATSMTYSIASFSKYGITPQRLVLAGLAISMMFGALSQYLAINYQLGRALAFWTAGSTAGAKWAELLYITPLFVIGVILAIILSPSITLLGLGEDVARGLGVRSEFVIGLSTIIVLILTGLAVVIVGPIGFVGLITPHIVRYLVGVDYRYIIPATILYGALFTVSADVIGRLINRPYETPIGIIFSLIGVPYFLFLAQRQTKEKI